MIKFFIKHFSGPSQEPSQIFISIFCYLVFDIFFSPLTKKMLWESSEKRPYNYGLINELLRPQPDSHHFFLIIKTRPLIVDRCLKSPNISRLLTTKLVQNICVCNILKNYTTNSLYLQIQLFSSLCITWHWTVRIRYISFFKMTFLYCYGENIYLK